MHNGGKHQLIWSLLAVLLINTSGVFAQWDFSTSYFKVHIDAKGFITSMKNISVMPNREFSPTDRPSALLRLYNGQQKNILSRSMLGIIK